MSHALIDMNLHILAQGLDLLERIGDDRYTAVLAGLSPSGVGSHLRHCLDFYQSFIHGFANGRIDYDRRQRDPRLAEDRHYAAARLQAVQRWLLALPADDLEVAVLVRQDSPVPADDETGWSLSTVARELQALASHTLHHYALMAVLLRLQGYEPGAEFGVAPATLVYWSVPAQCVQ